MKLSRAGFTARAWIETRKESHHSMPSAVARVSQPARGLKLSSKGTIATPIQSRGFHSPRVD